MKLDVPVIERVPPFNVPIVPVFAFNVVEVAVPKKPMPEAVKFVVDAPPFAEKRPLVMVEEA